MKKRGGQSKRTDAICDRIVEAVSDGVPLAQAARECGIGLTTVYDWKDQDAAFAERIARAREIGFDVIAARTAETARGRGDSAGDVQRDKLIIETDLKLLAKWDPKRYGEKTLLGSDPDNPLPATIQVAFVRGLPAPSQMIEHDDDPAS